MKFEQTSSKRQSWNKNKISKIVFEFQKFCSIPARCLKITEKVSFNVYILSGQKLIKMTKMIDLGDFLKSWSMQSNSRGRSGFKKPESPTRPEHFFESPTRPEARFFNFKKARPDPILKVEPAGTRKDFFVSKTLLFSGCKLQTLLSLVYIVI